MNFSAVRAAAKSVISGGPRAGSASRTTAKSRRAAVAAITAFVLAATTVVVGVTPASAATFTLTATRASSGTVTADAASTCATQGSTPTAHCAGYDTTLAATDQILRTGDTAQVRFDFAFSGADTGVVLRSTLPQANGGNAATWTAIPAACAAGSTRTDNNRTLNCLIANPQGPGDGSVTATFLLEGRALDGDTFTIPAEISSSTSAAVAAVSTATYTSSSAPMYDARRNVQANNLPQPFFYRSATGEPGFAIPTSTYIAPAKVGGFSPLAGPATWTETMTSAAVDVSSYRLLNWGNYGDGCAAEGTAATPGNAGYTGTALNISNQYNPIGGGLFDCAQPDGPGSPVQVTWQNPPVASSGVFGAAWVMLWVPLSAVPVGTTPAPTMTISAFDPNDVNGVSNYLAGTEPATAASNAGSHGQIVNADNRAITKQPISDAAVGPYVGNTAFPAAISQTTRGGSFVSMVTFQNTGTVVQKPVQLCDVIDVTTQRISPFTTGGVPANTYVVATTTGPTTDPILSPPYEPASSYNPVATNAGNWAVEPSSYIVEYAAGELGGSTPTESPLPAAALAGATCGDAGTATGWHSNPSDPAILSYAQSLGLSDPVDVINRVRITFLEDIEPGVMVAMKLHTTTRSTYRAATTQAGQMIFATTRIGDVATYTYPQVTVVPAPTAYAGPRIAGRINVDTAVDITASQTTVQAGAPGQNRTTFTLTASVAFGENVATTQPLRVIHRLPAGMRYVNGSASVNPAHVLSQADGSTLIVWDLGNISGTTNGLTTVPAFTFIAEADPLAPTPSTNHSTAVAESVSPTGAQIDPDIPIIDCASMLDVTIPPTANVPVQTTTQIPPALNYQACFDQLRNRRMDWQPITIGNAFLSLAALKTAFDSQIESGADDGVAGASVGWNLTYANKTSNTFPGVDIVDVLPYPGDGRSPESDFAGTVDLTSISTTDALSAVPNGLPVSATIQPARTGTTFYVTGRPPAQIERDPYAASNLQGGATTWCTLAQLGAAGCPADLAAVSAVRVISGSLATQEQEVVRLGFATEGAAAGDLMTNTATARVISVTTPVDISGDAIIFEASSIAGTVWVDSSADGVIDATEAGRLGGVSVRILGTATTSGATVDRTVTTAANGTYAFPGLPAGTYTVTVDAAGARAIDSSYALTADPDGPGSADGSFQVTLPLGTDLVNRNFGFGTQSLAGAVFGDQDNDGAIDAGEDGIGGVTVTVIGTDDLGAPVSRTVTSSASGAWTVDGLRPGTYQVLVAPPAGSLGGASVAGSAGGTGGPAGSNTIAAVPLAPGQNGVGYLFAMLEPEVIEGAVFSDLDGDGTRDAGEPGIPGVTITLGGDADLTTTTLADGSFVFAGLAPGEYTLTETQPVAFLNGETSLNGSVGSVDGDVISEIVVGSTTDNDGYTFGELTPASIAGVVYHDVNANGVQDAGEDGIAGASVTLSGAADVGPITTGADGSYLFSSLRPGTYAVTATEVDGYVDGLETVGSTGGVVDNGDATSDDIVAIELGVGEAATGYLFGDVQEASLAGAVWADANGDGIRDAAEAGIPGVTVTLTGTDMFGDAVSETATTLTGGAYSFTALPGTYTVTETQPAGYFDGADLAGTFGGTVGNDTVSGIVLLSGTEATGYLFGERLPAALSGAVFADSDGDGLRDAGESGIAGVTITLRDGSNAIVATTGTVADGSWSFPGIAPGTYSIVEEGQPLAGHVDGASVPGTAGGTPTANRIDGIVVGSAADGYLFAEIPLSGIRGFVWHDADDDGVFDASEAPIPGVEITLGGAATRTALTNADGSFVFGDLEAGTYTLTEEALTNWSDGQTLVGAAGGTGAVNSVTGIVVGPDQDASGYGFGERAAELQLFVSTQTLDAQTATGPYVEVGNPVRWTYRVVNNGDTSLDQIEVNDSEAGAVTCPATTLAPGAEMTCVLEGVAEAGQYENTGTVAAAIVPSGGGAGTTPLEASDVSHYFGAVVQAEVEVTVNGDSAQAAPGPVFQNGSELTVSLRIGNTGNVPLVIGAVDTGVLGALDCGGIATIAVGDSVECTLTWTPEPGNYAVPVSAFLAGPTATGVDGTTAATAAEPETTVFFQVLEANVPVPAAPGDPDGALGITGGTIDPRVLVMLVGLLVLGGGLVLGARHRRNREVLN